MFDQNRKLLAVIFLLVVPLVFTACSSAASTEAESGLVISPTVFVTVFVTPVMATPLPTTPTPEPSPTLAPGPTYIDQTSPYNVPIYYPLPGCAGSRLHLEDMAFVAQIDKVMRIYNTRNIAFDPGMRAMELGEEMEIIEGPTCNNGWLLWRVKTVNDEIRGWVPEGNGEVYFLLPVIGP